MEYKEAFENAHKKIMETHPELEPELTFASQESVAATPLLETTDRFLAQIAVCLGACGYEELKSILNAALDAGVSAEAIRETVYQAIAYLGLARVRPALKILSRALEKRNIQLENNQVTTPETRLEQGNAKQVELFGEAQLKSWERAADNRKNISVFLADNCFGDYYTRKGLDNRQRELVTFCYLYAQGGCEPQATSHAMANMRQGNSQAYLSQVVDACVFLIGYPRSLNGLGCIDAAAEKMKEAK